MKKIFSLLISTLFILMSLLSNSQNCKNIELIEINDTTYSLENKPYTGEYNEYFPGMIKTRGHYEDGLKNGEFLYTDKLENIKSIENWKAGKKHGKFLIYDDFPKLQSIEYFKNNKLDSLNYYFHYSGALQMVKNYKNGVLVDSVNYIIDDEIFEFLVSIPNEQNSEVDKVEMYKLDSISLSIIGLKYPPEEKKSPDTVVFSNLNILSFTISAIVLLNKEGALHIDWSRKFNSNVISIENIKSLFGHYARKFYIDNVIVENEDGYQWEVPNRAIGIKNIYSEIK